MIMMTAKCYNLLDTLLYEINPSNCKSISFDNMDRKDLLSPSYSLISNGGTVTFKGNLNTAKKIYKIEIYITNTKTNYSELIGTYISRDISEYEGLIKIEFEDRLQQLKNINIKYDFTITNALSIYQQVARTTSLEFPQPLFEEKNYFAELDEETSSHLSSIENIYVEFKELNLWKFWSYFAEATLTHISTNQQGLICVKYNGGR